MAVFRVQGIGREETLPDRVEVRFVVGSENTHYSECITELDRRMRDLRSKLATAGIRPEEVRTSRYAVTRKLKYRDGEATPSGFEAGHTVAVQIPADTSRLNDVLTAVTRGRGEVMLTIEFSVRDTEGLRRRALAKAVADARRNAEVLAEAAGVPLPPLEEVRFAEQESGPSTASYEVLSLSEPSAPGPDIQPGDVVAVETVVLTFGKP